MFSVMVDETRNVSNTEQLVFCLCYVDDQLLCHEEFIVLHCKESTTAQSPQQHRVHNSTEHHIYHKRHSTVSMFVAEVLRIFVVSVMMGKFNGWMQKMCCNQYPCERTMCLMQSLLWACPESHTMTGSAFPENKRCP